MVGFAAVYRAKLKAKASRAVRDTMTVIWDANFIIPAIAGLIYVHPDHQDA